MSSETPRPSPTASDGSPSVGRTVPLPEVRPRADRPYVWANCAVSLDGKLAYAQGKRAQLSSPEDLVRVQRLRLSLDAILVGIGTVLADDPSLRVHRELLGEDPAATSDGPRPGPLRIILDSAGRTPPQAKVLDGKQPTVILTSQHCTRRFPRTVETSSFGTRQVLLRPALRWLLRKGVRSVLVEGGSQVLASFLKEGLVDRLTVYQAPCLIGGSTAPSMIAGPETTTAAEVVRLNLLGVERLGEGLLSTWEPPRSDRPA